MRDFGCLIKEEHRSINLKFEVLDVEGLFLQINSRILRHFPMLTAIFNDSFWLFSMQNPVNFFCDVEHPRKNARNLLFLDSHHYLVYIPKVFTLIIKGQAKTREMMMILTIFLRPTALYDCPPLLSRKNCTHHQVQQTSL